MYVCVNLSAGVRRHPFALRFPTHHAKAQLGGHQHLLFKGL